MKTTLLLKQSDIALQILCLLTPILYTIITSDSGFLFAIYFAVGAAQIISCFANKLYLEDTLRSNSRKTYEIVLLITMVIGLIVGGGLLISPAFGGGVYIYLIALLFISPFLAIWYGFISFAETNYVKKLANRKMYV